MAAITLITDVAAMGRSYILRQGRLPHRGRFPQTIRGHGPLLLVAGGLQGKQTGVVAVQFHQVFVGL